MESGGFSAIDLSLHCFWFWLRLEGNKIEQRVTPTTPKRSQIEKMTLLLICFITSVNIVLIGLWPQSLVSSLLQYSMMFIS